MHFVDPVRAGCEWIVQTWAALRNQAGVGGDINVWKTAGHPNVDATFVCHGNGSADLTWTLNNGDCQVGGSAHYVDFYCQDLWAYLTGGASGSYRLCCGGASDYPQVWFAFDIWTSVPLPTGVPPKAPAPCTYVPEEQKECCLKQGGCGGSSGAPAGRDRFVATGSRVGASSVSCSTGEVQFRATDIASHGFGRSWGHTRSFASRQSYVEVLGNGYNWKVAELPYLVLDSDGNVVAQGQPHEALWFTQSGDNYVTDFNGKQTLVLDSSEGVYRLHGLDGTVTEFSVPFSIILASLGAERSRGMTSSLAGGSHAERTELLGGRRLGEGRGGSLAGTE